MYLIELQNEYILIKKLTKKVYYRGAMNSFQVIVTTKPMGMFINLLRSDD